MFNFFNVLFVNFFNLYQQVPFTTFNFENFIGDTGQLLILFNFTFLVSLYGIIVNKKNFLLTMLYIELMYVSIFAYFITGSIFLNSPIGQIYAILLLIIAACESSIGLGILIVLFYKKQTIKFDDFTELRG
jgi:NADH-quinone oxidoreductase subunit K